MPKSFQIQSEQDDIVLRFNRSLVDSSTLSRLLEYVEVASIQNASELNQEQADQLADEVDAAVWEHVKAKYTS